MDDVLMRTACAKWRLARATNTTDASYPTRANQSATPSGTGNSASQTTAGAVHVLGQDVPHVPSFCTMKFFGVQSDNNTFKAKLLGWTFVRGVLNGQGDGYWDVTDLFEVTVTMSSAVTGVAGKIIDNTNLFADTISLTTGTAVAGVNINIVSPANDRCAYLTVDFVGFDRIEPIFSLASGGGTSMNALMRLF